MLGRQKKRQIAEDTEKAAEDLAEKAAQHEAIRSARQEVDEKNLALKTAIANTMNEIQSLRLSRPDQSEAPHSSQQVPSPFCRKKRALTSWISANVLAHYHLPLLTCVSSITTSLGKDLDQICMDKFWAG